MEAVNSFIDDHIENETKERKSSGVLRVEQAEVSMWKVYTPIAFLLGSVFSAFYALVVGSGSVALSAIGLCLLGLFLGIYFIKDFIKKIGELV